MFCCWEARAEVVYSNLNTDPSAPFAYGYTQFAQRFTTISAGTGLNLDLNLISLNGAESYSAELWSANGSGNAPGSLLASIGSGLISTQSRTAITSLNLTYALAPATQYFVKLTTSPNLGWAIGPNSSTNLNSVFLYGVASFNTDNTIAGGMKVEVVAAGVPEIAPAGIGSLLALFTGALVWLERRRIRAS